MDRSSWVTAYLYGLDGAHEVDQPRALEIAFTIEVGGRTHEDPLHFFSLADVLAPDREERGNRARHVRRGHARAAVLDVQRVALRRGACSVERRAGAARDDLFARRDEVRLRSAVARGSLGREIRDAVHVRHVAM